MRNFLTTTNILFIRDPKIVCALVGNKCDMTDKRVYNFLNIIFKGDS